MNVLINHCWCSDSNWGGGYDCRVIVSLYRVPEGKTYYDPPCPDWSLIEEHPRVSADAMRNTTLRLRPDVVAWLSANVKDRKVPSYVKGGVKGWAVGSDAYNAHAGISFSLFLNRHRDAMAFIKRWSVHRLPVSYLQYFTDVRKELDPVTGTLKRVPR